VLDRRVLDVVLDVFEARLQGVEQLVLLGAGHVGDAPKGLAQLFLVGHEKASISLVCI